MSYTRVIPRDLFNEAKLIKCLGQLALHIHDGDSGLRLNLSHDEPESGFRIDQNRSDASLYCENLELTCGFRLVGLRLPYNSRDAYPLQFWADDIEGRVFDDDGAFSAEFRAAIESLQS